MAAGLMSRETVRTRNRLEPDSRVSPVSASREELRQRFQERYPILLDGALSPNHDAGLFFRQARDLLIRGKVEPELPPPDILRETLDAVVSVPKPSGRAGSVVVGPRSARVWWDEALLEGNAGDILSGLTKPRPVLRFYDVTGLPPTATHWNSVFDLDVALADRGRTVDFWAADRVYAVELGLIHADGRFLRLARAGRFELPRECRGTRAVAERILSALRPRPNRPDPLMVPDAAAREWAGERADYAGRDIETELLVRMVYQAFLREGPRALRRAAPPARRDGEVLAREFAHRSRSRRQAAAASTCRDEAPASAPLAVRLDVDSRSRLPKAELTYPPVPVAEVRTWRRAALPALPKAVVRIVAAAPAREIPAIQRQPAAVVAAPAAAASAASVVRRENGARQPLRRFPLVRPLADSAGKSLTDDPAAPVFAAAEALRRRLSELTPVPQPAAAPAAAPEQIAPKTPAPVSASEPAPAPAPAPAPESARDRACGGAEAERFARAGIVFSRLVLTIEGRARPGSRLKVAGRSILADAEGHFRFECAVSGRKSRLPLRAANAVGVEERGVVTVEWEKRRARSGVKV